MIYRQARKARVWYDTDFCRNWSLTGYLAAIWGKLFAYTPPLIPENDTDHIRW